jgi:hypothetical protein
MFGKDDSLVDKSYQPSVAPQPANEMGFGSAGGDFMSAPATPASPALDFEAQPAYTPAPQNDFMQQAEPAAPAFDTAPLADAPAEMATPHEQPASSVPDSMSFSQRFGSQAEPEATAPEAEMQAPPAADPFAYAEEPAPAMEQPAEAAPSTAYAQDDEALPAFGDFQPQEPVADQEAAFESAPEGVAPTETDIAAAMDAPLTETTIAEPEAFPPQQTADERLIALQQAAIALGSEAMAKADGSTRIQATALKVLVEKAQREDGTALDQLSNHGFSMLEKLASGLQPGSPALDQVVESATALISSELVAPTSMQHHGPHQAQQRSFVDRVQDKPTESAPSIF